MSAVTIFFRCLMHHFGRMSWNSLIGFSIAHFVIGYWICVLTGQSHLVDSWHSYFHFWLVTISTVGYGDLYAQGGVSRPIVDIWFIGLGLGLFGSILGKTAELILHLITRQIQGMKNYHHLTGHIIVFCNDRLQAIQLIDLLLADKKRQRRQILLVTTDAELAHPFPEQIDVEFARVASFTHSVEVDRIALKNAHRVIINSLSDDENLALTVHVAGIVPSTCHVVTHFDDESYIQSLQRLKLNVECSTSKRVEQLARASQDHGATAVINQLLDTRTGMTLYVDKLPHAIEVGFADFKHLVYQKLGAVVIGVAYDELGKTLELLPDADLKLNANLYLHYLSPERHHLIDALDSE